MKIIKFPKGKGIPVPTVCSDCGRNSKHNPEILPFKEIASDSCVCFDICRDCYDNVWDRYVGTLIDQGKGYKLEAQAEGDES